MLLNKLLSNKLFGSVIIIRKGTTDAKEISSRKPQRFNKISKKTACLLLREFEYSHNFRMILNWLKVFSNCI